MVPAARVVQDRLDDSVRVQVEVERISNLEAGVQHFNVPLELDVEAQLRVDFSEHLIEKVEKSFNKNVLNVFRGFLHELAQGCT